MNIAGLQKMTLLDFPNKIACTLFLNGCNYRCPFCHNSEILDGKLEPLMTEEEFLSFLAKRKGLLEGVCVSGGEPTLCPELKELLMQIKDMGYAVKLDTNGSRPAVLKDLAEAGLVDYVAMDIKNCPDRYAETAGLKQVDLASVAESAAYLMAGNLDFEFRTTVVDELHTAQDMVKMGRWLTELSGGKPVKKLFLQPFTDRDTVAFSGLHAPDKAKLEAFTELLKSFVLEINARG